jgi:aspartate aminotransferase
LGRSFGGRVANSTTELAEMLLESIKIAVVPGEAFGTPGYFRLSSALGDADLAEGLERFAKYVAAG